MNEWEQLKAYVKATDADDLFVEECWNEGKELVDAFIGSVEVPAWIYTRAVMETSAALYHRRSSQNGIAGFTGQGQPVFSAKDPMNSVYPLLRRYVGWF